MTKDNDLLYLDETEEAVDAYFKEHDIPALFYQTLFAELVQTFGPKMLIPDPGYLAANNGIDNIVECDETGYSYKEQLETTFSMLSGTAGWNEALQKACQKCGLDWLLMDYNRGDWVYSDIFDGYIVEKMVNIVFNNDK